ncbi:hypothetical protein RJ640_005601 [Escallonia rubra]|uniref:Uncharacterized protein n=1 Tax=Escallonia rubra TaxID=112253 RepID=A0AA88QTW8_9ASTE|nr:hypothetical protein RJ640_005601 [Escallonia rubra]
MSNMIGKLRDAGHALTDEQQVRAVIRSILASWANMKQILTHSENIKNFSVISQYVILEAETRDANKTLTYVAKEGSRNANGKCGRQSVAVGCGWQAFVAYVNVGCYYVVGIPLGSLLGFKFNLGVKGIWSGMLGGTAMQTIILLWVTIRTDWSKEVRIAFSLV